MKDLTAGQITRDALLELERRNCYVWRNNNLSVPGRKFTGLKGVPDIVGFQKLSGVAVYCEVKTINDKFSDFQRNFMIRAKTAGCLCLVAYDVNGVTQIKTYD